jgi:hypothetical protein
MDESGFGLIEWAWQGTRGQANRPTYRPAGQQPWTSGFSRF